MSRRLAVLVVLLTIVLAAPSAVTAQDATPPSLECIAPEIPPGTPTVLEEGSPDAAIEGTPEGEGAAAPSDASRSIPVGEPASDEVVAEVLATVQNAVNCFNSGMFVEFAALHTPDGLMSECGTTNVHDGPMCFGGPFQLASMEIADTQVHDDGRVSTETTYQLGNALVRERIFFEKVGEFWLFDESYDLPAPIPEGATVVTGQLTDYEFVLDATSAPAGAIAFQVTNTGEYPHEIVMLQLPEGITIEDVFEDESLFEQVQFYGFTFAMPGEEAPPLVMVDMQPGTYTLVCFVDEPEGVPHVMRGMVLEFEVTAAS